MAEPMVQCPQCKTEFKLTESLAGPLVASVKKDYEDRLARDQAGLAKREADLQETLKKQEEKLAESQKAQAELLRKQRELDEEKREMELTVEKRIQESVAVVREQAAKQAEAEVAVKLKEKDSAMKALEKKLADEQLKKEQELKSREAALQQQKDGLAKERASLDEKVAEKLKEERDRIVQEEAKKARTAVESDLAVKNQELSTLQETLKKQDEKLAESQKAQAELLRKQRELDEEKREMELTIEKRIQSSLEATHALARKQAEEELTLKLKEKEHTIGAMQEQIAELKRRAEQGSQQLQGEVQELELEGLLSAQFHTDSIEPVPKGQFGGDVVHKVLGPQGVHCGTILWEAKRTKNWTDSWLPKLRDDQRAAKADIAILVSRVLPKGVDTFDFRDGVWVTSPSCALPLASALRHGLFELMRARRAGEGQQTKMEMLYDYLTGPGFRHRIQAIVEKFSEMQSDLEKERRSMTKAWSKREIQIRTVLDSTAGMYGDLQGIAGKTLQEIDGLEMKMLPAAGASEPSTD